MAKMSGRKAKILDQDPRDDIQDKKQSDDELAPLVEWVVDKVRQWDAYRDANLVQYWDEYERLWRGLWSPAESQRKSERSRIISPALSEAVENSVAEIEEGLFARGPFFDVDPEFNDNPVERQALEHNKKVFREDVQRMNYVANVSECLINAAVYGNGIAEIVMKEDVKREIRPKQLDDGKFVPEVHAEDISYPILRSVNPRNFLIDPRARNVDEALGCAVEDEVGAHEIRQGQADGDYRKVKFGLAMQDYRKDLDPQMKSQYESDGVPIIRYYGLVPTHLLYPEESTETLVEGEDPKSTQPGETDMTEAIVVIANEETCLKACSNPYMMEDRPIISFQWDVLPGNFFGRGVAEKGAAPQRLLDAELRSRMDALAFSGAPMMALDATRLPRGFKFNVYPGRSLLLNGPPQNIMQPMKFGEVDQNTYQQAQLLDQYVQRATGALDAVNMAQQGAGGQARSGAVSMSLAGIMKRHRRTMMRVIDLFIQPSIRKLMWRCMQYEPDRYMPMNASFIVTSNTGIMQREYEINALTQLLASMQPGTVEHLIVLGGIINNTSLKERDKLMSRIEEMIKTAQEAQQPGQEMPQMDPVMMQLQQMDAQLEMAKKQAETARLNAQTRLYDAQAQHEMVKPQLEFRNMMLKGVYAEGENADREFDRRMRIADQMLKREDILSNERIAQIQMQGTMRKSMVDAQAKVRTGMLSAQAQNRAAEASEVAALA